MKVVHINTYQNKGAALCARRIHKALSEQGIDSKMLFAEGDRSDEYDVIESGYKWSSFFLIRKVQSFLCKLHLWPSYERIVEQRKKINSNDIKVYYTLPVSTFHRILDHPWLKDADIIHLHWVSNFVDYPTFFKSVNKPIVWTFHDENPGLGGYHYDNVINHAYDKLEKKLVEIKKKAIQNKDDIYLVAISSMMKDFMLNNEALKNKQISIIHNGVDLDTFVSIPKDIARQKIIPGNKDCYVVLFSSWWLMDPRKGITLLIEALEGLNVEKPITLIGLGDNYDTPRSSKINIICPGLISNTKELSLYYSASDLFVLSSFKEAFAQTPLESMACGTPVVAFPCSGAHDLITIENGVVCDDFTVESLKRAIFEAYNKKYDSEIIKEIVKKRFSYDVIAKQYLTLYKSILT